MCQIVACIMDSTEWGIMEFKEVPMADLANIKLRVNAHGNIVVVLDMPKSKEVNALFNDDGGPTTYGFMIKQIINKFEDEYHRINDDMRDLIKGVRVD